ncbi:hypothetical protein [Oceanirhabdus seepicola]|uniref:Uncharacterized protein n=1 Tax=Oceanirhabdus seepicola TaxID=2828781 RepID=A0A9J6P6Q6_9CLOT|nr:hypothetical protein [Oceanirhabdus seepicola]MCM1991493.1 hypothetical protein [Oceanirhabdus seepicola]
MIFEYKLKYRIRTCLIFSSVVILSNYFMKLDFKVIVVFLFASNLSVLIDRGGYKIENKILYINNMFSTKEISIKKIKYVKKSIIDLKIIFFKNYRKGSIYIFYDDNKSIEISTNYLNHKKQTLLEYLTKECKIKYIG